jgi:hypothetical protein
VTSRSEGYLRFVEGVVAMATGVKTTGRPDSGQAIARRAGGDRPSSARDDTRHKPSPDVTDAGLEMM